MPLPFDAGNNSSYAIASYGPLYIKGGSIYGCSSNDYAAVTRCENGPFEMSGGEIYGCRGGGYYGGGGTNRNHSGAGGGSGYIGNSRLFNAVMYCYGCTEDGNDGTRTISTTGSNKDSVNCTDSVSANPLSNCAKSGDGYAIITYVGQSLN